MVSSNINQHRLERTFYWIKNCWNRKKFITRISQIRVSSFSPNSYRYRLLQTNKIAIKSNAELVQSFSKICVRNNKKCQNLYVESSKIYMQNHQDNYLFDKRSLQKWCQHDKMAACCNFRQFRVIEDDLNLFCNVFHYNIMVRCNHNIIHIHYKISFGQNVRSISNQGQIYWATRTLQAPMIPLSHMGI